jgi:uncharacterized DUF497 family protein
MALLFEWNRRKAAANVRKHGVSFEEAAAVFGDSLARVIDDPDHSDNEVRDIIIGYSTNDRLLFVSFTERRGWLRILSARRATPRERREHEEANFH